MGIFVFVCVCVWVHIGVSLSIKDLLSVVSEFGVFLFFVFAEEISRIAWC